MALLSVKLPGIGVYVSVLLAGVFVFSAQVLVYAYVGHVYPAWLRFRGGKGVATACGVFSILTPLALPPALAIFFVGVWTTKYISLGSVLATVSLPAIAYATGSPAVVVVCACAAAVMIVFRHRSNLARVRTGTERRVGARA